MKVTLIPGMTIGLKRTDASKTTMSLGVLALAANLELNGYQTDIIDIDYFIDNNKFNIDSELYKKVSKHLISTGANVFGFYVAVGTLHHAVNISKELKKLDNTCTVFFGGPHATAVHNEIVSHFDHVDYILRGECDKVIVDFISALDPEKKIRIDDVTNITYIDDNGQLQINNEAELISDLDVLPIPAYYKHKTERDVLDIIPIDVGRGCPYNCTFCSTSVFWKKSYRSKSVDRILKEMHYIKELFNAKKVFLMHDCLTADRKMLLKICNAIRENDVDLEWGCAARLDHLNKETLEILRNSKCTHLEIGIESGSELVRSSINKKLGPDATSLLEKLQEIHDMGFSLVLFFICGFPNERNDDINATLNMIRDTLNIMKGNGFFRLTYLELFAGTKLYNDEKEKAGFSEKLLDENSIKLYTKEEIEIARTTNLFPEFFFVTNDNLDSKYFRELSSVYSSVIKVLGTEFYLTYSKLLECFKNDIHQFFITWKEFEKIQGGSFRESHIITQNLSAYIAFLSKYFALPEYLKELAEYELMVYLCRQKFLRYHITSEEKLVGPLFEDAVVKKFVYDIPSIINQIKYKNEVVSCDKNADNTYLLVYMLSSEKINVIKVNQQIHDVLMLCNGINTVDNIVNKLSKNIQGSSVNKDQIKIDIINLFTEFENMHLLRR